VDNDVTIWMQVTTDGQVGKLHLRPASAQSANRDLSPHSEPALNSA